MRYILTVLLLSMIFACTKENPKPPSNGIAPGLPITVPSYTCYTKVYNNFPDDYYVAIYKGGTYELNYSLLQIVHLNPNDHFVYQHFPTIIPFVSGKIEFHYNGILNNDSIYWDTTYIATPDTVHIFTP